MALIIILVCVIVQRIANIGGWFGDEWVQLYLRKLQPALQKFNSWVILFFVIGPILLGLGLLHLLSLGHLYGLLHFGLALAVLFFCTDMRDLRDRLTGYFAALDKGNSENAIHAAKTVVDVPAVKNIHDLARVVTKDIFTYSFEFVFAPLFWFITFNIYGVIFYYLIVAIQKNALAVDAGYEHLVKVAMRVQNILDWLPMRIVALSYALAGHFMTSFTDYYQKLLSFSFSADDFVIKAGLLAIEADPVSSKKSDSSENHAALSLINRVLLIWIIGVTLFTLGRWFT